MLNVTVAELKGSKSLLDKYTSSIFLVKTYQGISLCCNAQRANLVQEIRRIKNNFHSKFAVIPPGRVWIETNCKHEKDLEKYLDLYDEASGALSNKCYTLVLKLTNFNAVSTNVAMEDHTIGVKISDHPFFDFVKIKGIPVLSTTPSVTGSSDFDNLEDIDPNILHACSFIITDFHSSKNVIKETKIIRW